MGQYQQWLHYREVEQHLQTQLEILKQELVQLQAQAHCLEQKGPNVLPAEIPNQIIHALASVFNKQTAPLTSTTEQTQAPQPPLSTLSPATAQTQPRETISMAVLPEDMPNFFDQHAPTDPQLELPRWLHNLTMAPGENGPIDQESMRNNRLVQRWVERWRKQPPGPINSKGEPS